MCRHRGARRAATCTRLREVSWYERLRTGGKLGDGYRNIGSCPDPLGRGRVTRPNRTRDLDSSGIGYLRELYDFYRGGCPRSGHRAVRKLALQTRATACSAGIVCKASR
jgi:hypothetical protein